METIAELLTEQFIQREIVSPDKREIYRIGLNLILADLINITVILVVGILLKVFVYSCIYLLLFWTVRRFSGGFHAGTYGVCRAVTIGSFMGIVIISKDINNNWLVYSITCDLIVIVTMITAAPVRHPNKELTSIEIKANKLFSIITTSFFSASSIILIELNRKEGLIISLTLLAISILMYVGMFVNTKGGKEKCQK